MSAGGRGGMHATRIISASHSNHIVTPQPVSFDTASHDNTSVHQPSSTSRPPRDYSSSFPRYVVIITQVCHSPGVQAC